MVYLCPSHSTSAAPLSMTFASPQHKSNMVFFTYSTSFSTLFTEETPQLSIFFRIFVTANTETMRHLKAIHILCAVVALLCYTTMAVAQDIGVNAGDICRELGYDYRQYKLYDEEYDIEIIPLQDTLPPILRPTEIDVRNAQYALRTYGLRAQGVAIEEESYTIGPLEIEYRSASRLMRLGLQHNKVSGIDNINISKSIASTTEILLGDERAPRYEGHYLRGELSGRGYIGGLSHRATWKPLRNGIRLDGEWTITHYASARSGRDLYIDGVFSNSIDLGVEASKSTRRSALSIVLLLPYYNQGLRQASTAEAFSLTGNTLYNPSWGMQQGKIRNARVLNSFMPEVIARWDYRLSAVSTLHLATDIHYQLVSLSSLNWYNAPTPLPDNYRHMPSYYTDARNVEVTEAWVSNNLAYTQIDWQGLYHTNALQSDGHARYAVDNRREDITRTALTAYITSQIFDVKVTAGAVVDYNTAHHFKLMDDLLGADHIIDLDYYLIDDYTYGNKLQNNLRDPNRKIHEGDKYGYDYRLSRMRTTLFANALWSYGRGDISAVISMAAERTRRNGYFEKELFAGRGSYGRSESVALNPYHIALGWQHWLGKHTLQASVMARGESPEADDLFLQTEYNNRRVESVALQTSLASHFIYHYTPNQVIDLSAMLFATFAINNCDVVHYYDDLARKYTDAVICNIASHRFGIELRANVAWSRYLSSTFLATAMRCRYSDSATISLYADSDNSLIAQTSAAMQGHNTGTPEIGLYGDIEFYARGWRIRASAYYCGQRYVSPSFIRRSQRVFDLASTDEHRAMLDHQQRLGDAASIDLNISKHIRLDWGTINIQFSARNIFGINAISNGYEQNRIRRVVIQERAHLEPFDNRLRYDYGRTFYLGIGLWF